MTENRADIGNQGPHAERFVEEGVAFSQLASGNALKPASTQPAGARGRGPVARPTSPERFDVIVIGGGQAGLSVGYYLAKRGLRFVILDACERVGDTWRKRWDSLRLFTPARYDGLVGMPFPAPPHSFPTKDQMGDYLEAYVARFELPVRSGVPVDRVSRQHGRYLVTAGELGLEAAHVVIAMSSYQQAKVPDFAHALRADIVQLHSSAYKNLSQLRKGGVLLAGAGNSGSEIALESVRDHTTWMSGRDTGEVPFRIASFWGRLFLVRLVLRVLFHRVMTVRTPIGRRLRAKLLRGGGPLIRVRSKELAAAGVVRVPKTVGVRDGLPLLEDGRVLDVANVVWCTGFHPGHSFIDLPVFDTEGAPLHESGVVNGEPGLYFVGLHFLHAMSSTMIHGVGRDAARIVGTIAARLSATEGESARALPNVPRLEEANAARRAS
jgi:putative flavoprotein involved in K+ transport